MELVIECVRIGLVVAVLVVLAVECARLRRFGLAAMYGIGAAAYAVGQLATYRRGSSGGEPPSDVGPVGAKVPRPPRTGSTQRFAEPRR